MALIGPLRSFVSVGGWRVAAGGTRWEFSDRALGPEGLGCPCMFKAEYLCLQRCHVAAPRSPRGQCAKPIVPWGLEPVPQLSVNALARSIQPV
jgi:hypothetical protein